MTTITVKPRPGYVTVRKAKVGEIIESRLTLPENMLPNVFRILDINNDETRDVFQQGLSKGQLVIVNEFDIIKVFDGMKSEEKVFITKLSNIQGIVEYEPQSCCANS